MQEESLRKLDHTIIEVEVCHNDGVTSHIGERRYSLLRLLIQMVISSKNTLRDTLGRNILPVIWAFLSPVKVTQKNNHHKNMTIKS